jgi:NADPH2:quinone reductase
MKAIVLTKLGGANVLKVKEIPKPSIINPTDVLIKIKYSGINFAEILARRGLYKWVPARKGFILGMEGSGIVEEVGNEVTNCKVGDPVIFASGFTGSFMTAYVALVKMVRCSGNTLIF